MGSLGNLGSLQRSDENTTKTRVTTNAASMHFYFLWKPDLVVADVRVECRDQHERFVQQFVDAIAIGFDAHDAVLGEGAAAVRQQADRPQNVRHDQRLEDVQFEMAVASTCRSVPRIISTQTDAPRCVQLLVS